MTTASTHAFSEKVALVAGIDDPVGRAVALQLALSGAFVILGCDDASQHSSLEDLTSLGTLARIAEGDAADADGAERLVAAAETAFGRLDLLVNCSGQRFRAAESSQVDIDAEFSAPVRAALQLVKAAERLMIDRPKPRIVNIFRLPIKNSSDPVGAARAGAMTALTESLAGALPSKFRINAVAVAGDKAEMEIDEVTLLRRPGGVSPDDVARVVMFLLSGEAVAVNGRIIRVE